MRALSILGCCAEIAWRHLCVNRRRSAVIAQERKRKSGRGWCSEVIAGITATTSFPGLITLAKIGTVFSLIVRMIVRMRSENSC
jgi:hypothetical protein